MKFVVKTKAINNPIKEIIDISILCKGHVDLDPGWVYRYENSLNLNLIVPDGL